MKRRVTAGITVALLAALGIATGLAHRFGAERTESAPFESRMPASIPDRAPVPKSARTPHRSSSDAANAPARSDGYYREYFERMRRDNAAAERLYKDVLSRLPPGECSELLAIYVAEGPFHEGSGDFVHFMSSLHQEIATRSPELYSLLLSQDAALKQDAFIYQMALNLAFNLAVPAEAKAQVIGLAMEIHFAREGETGVTRMSANITNALILMRNAGVTTDQAMPFVQKGLAVNRDDPDALREFVARVRAYYPGAI